MTHRDFIKLSGAVGLAALPIRQVLAVTRRVTESVVVVGAGVFGIWTAWYLHKNGYRVSVVDNVGPAHSAASSGGESRVTRCGYGGEDLYTEWVYCSIFEWRALSERTSLPLFHETGVLWLHNYGNPLIDMTRKTLTDYNLSYTLLSAKELRARFPVLAVQNNEAGFYEPLVGGLMARGVKFTQGKIEPISALEL